MVARGAINNPMIFSEITGIPPKISFKDAVLKHITMLESRIGSERTAVVFRKQMAYYLKGIRDSKKLKDAVFKATDSSEIKSVIINNM